MKRTLIYIPIAHSREDMGSLGQRLGADEAYRRTTKERWLEIRHQVRALALNWSKAKVYQDGLPDVEPEIVQKILASVQSPNYDLLRWLIAQGAEVIGTESPDLIREEYDHLRTVLEGKSAAARERARRAYAERAGALLVERDAYIARRINDTLPPGGMGLLFIGRAHRVADLLPTDISIRSLTNGRNAAMPGEVMEV